MENSLLNQQDIKTDIDEIQQDFELTTLGTIGAGALAGAAFLIEQATKSEVASTLATTFGALGTLGIGRMVYDEVRLTGLRRRLSDFQS